MKTLIIILASIFMLSCEANRDNDHYNPAYLIQVNFKSKRAWEGLKELRLASEKASEICSKIAKGHPIDNSIKYSVLCLGENDKGIGFIYLFISGNSNSGYYLVEYDIESILTHEIPSYNSAACGKRWIISN